MSLISALNIGQSALAVSQAQIQTTGNNIANAGSPDYTRQVAGSTPSADQQLRPGMFVGTGVDLTGVQRQIDEALQGRIRAGVSDSASADAAQQWLGRIESVFNALSGQDLSTAMSTFFNSWSNLANKPQDIGLRQVVLQNGDAVAHTFQDLRGRLDNLQLDVGNELKGLTAQADTLSQQIAGLNAQILSAEGASGGSANALRDQRDGYLKQLSQLIDIRTIEQPGGIVNVYAGSEPLVLNADSRGVALRQDVVKGVTTNGQVTFTPIFKSNNGTITATGGQIGALVGIQQQANGAVDQVDSLAKGLIFELNKLHASGQGLQGFSSVTATNAATNLTVPLNDPASGLKFPPNNGSFVVHVKQKATGLETSTLVQIDLDGLNGNDTTLASLTASLSSINGVNANASGGKLAIRAASPDLEISFSQDSSGTLAALGINNFYTGSDARDIAVSKTLVSQPALLAAAKNGEKGDNQVAQAIAALEGQPVASLSGVSLKDSYSALVGGIAASTSAAKTNAEAAKSISDTLDAQRQALSGVSLDEEAINLMRQQRAFQGAAKLITTIDEMMKTLLAMT